MNIIFAGTPTFAAEQLKALLTTSHNISAVYTQPDRPSGRGLKVTPSPVKEVALSHQLPIEQPVTLKDSTSVEKMMSYPCDVLIVVGYGLILPQKILAFPRFFCMNTHLSLLPAYRGASCVQYAILNSDEKTGVTFMKMNEGLDTGDILIQKELNILATDTTQTLTERLSVLTAKTLVDELDYMIHEVTPMPQNNALSSYAPKIEKKEAKINWSLEADVIDRQIRAYHPWPVAYFSHGDKTIKIHRASPVERQHTSQPGTILHITPKSMIVACGNNAIEVFEIQLPGKKRIKLSDAMNAYQTLFSPGTLFE